MEFNVGKLMRSAIKNFQPYQAKDYPGVVKLDANENPYAWPAGLATQLYEQVRFNRYPDPEARVLRQKISAYTGVDVNNVMVGNGSDELIQMLLLAFGGDGTKTVVATPTFTMYSLATEYLGGQVVEVPLVNGCKLDVAGMLAAAADPQANLVILCNPNNPTGNTFAPEDIRAIIAGTDKLVVLDEAYYEFAGASLVSELADFPNLVILRTFSKAFAMAGLRIGYLLAAPNITNVLQRVRQPYNSNSFSQAAGALALDFLPQFQSQIQQILRERDKLVSFLGAQNLRQVYPTDANFILFAPHSGAKQLHQQLLDRNISIRYMGNLPVVGESLRVSIGLPAENELFMTALAAVI